ncbi:MAG: PD40 domain-containing protein [Acidobacteria bacterium]|nr:PD40 domain-containing protein [Acidobacteriota bacterium]
MKRNTRRGNLSMGAFGTVLLLAVVATAAPKYSEWSAPVNLGPVVNSPYFDAVPALSKDGLSLYFVSTRPGGYGGMDIWVSQRATTDSPWGTPVNLGPTVNTPYHDGAPALSRDGHLLFLNSNRPGGVGGWDLWVAARIHTRDDFGWQPPVNLGPAVNSSATEWHPSYFENDDGLPQIHFTTNRAGSFEIYVSELGPGGVWGAAAPVPSLNSPSYEGNAFIRHDGLEVFLTSDRNLPGPWSSNDLFVSTRIDTLAPWSVPANLGPIVNSTSSDNVPSISADGLALVFGSDRSGGYGGSDLYMCTRTKIAGPE